MGVTESTGELLFFFDNHCVVRPEYFDRVYLDVTHYDTQMLHSTTVFHEGMAGITTTD
jgi:hypothetical protein